MVQIHLHKTIYTLVNQTISGVTYGFSSWNDGNTSISRTINAGSHATYTANFIQITTSGNMPSSQTWHGTINLTGNVTVPSGAALNIASDAAVNYNGYGIISTGGSINDQSSFSGAYLKQSGSIKGYFGTIASAVSYASSGQTVQLQSRTYNENISVTNKSNIDITGAGSSSSIISGNISFNSSQGCYVSNLRVNNIDLNYGSGMNTLIYLNVQGRISPNMGSTSNISDIDMTASGSYGIMGGYSTVYATRDNIRSKSAAGISGSALTLTGDCVNLCQNTMDVTNNGGSNTIYFGNCTFSSSTEGGKINSAGVTWNFWAYCGMGKMNVMDKVTVKELPSALDRLTGNKKTDGEEDYILAFKDFNILMEKIYKENEDKKAFDLKQYEAEVNNIIAKYTSVIKKYAGTLSSINSLRNVISLYRQTEKQREAKQLINELLENKDFSGLTPDIKLISIPLLIDDQKYNEASALCDQLSKEMKGTTEAAMLIYNKAKLMEVFNNDKEGSDAVYSLLIEKYENSLWANLAGEQLGKEIKAGKTANIKKTDGFTLDTYPNPFNPVTTIKYRIPENGFVTLKIFDALGREIKTLVSEYKSGGEYSVDFNASGLVSGVYISQLRMNDFVQSKKMILLK